MQQSVNKAARSASRRAAFMRILGGVVVLQVIAMVMVVRSHMHSAQERQAFDAASRVAQAECFGADRASDLCARGGVPRKIVEVTTVGNVTYSLPGPASSAKIDVAPGKVTPAGFAAVR